MAWYELRLAGLPRADLDYASAKLFEAGASGLQEAWPESHAIAFPQPWDAATEAAPPDPLDLIAWFEDPDINGLRDAVSGFAVPAALQLIEDQDWVGQSREGFQPIRISDTLVIAAPWNAPPGALVIEPGQGFGTGQHPTTQQALRGLAEIAANHETLLDVGTGSGVLALAGARMGLRAHGIDVDEAALADARRNATTNQLPVTFSADLVTSLTGRFDVVVANLHAELLVTLADALVERTGGALLLAGILEDKEALVRTAFPGHPTRRHLDHGWVCLHYAMP